MSKASSPSNKPASQSPTPNASAWSRGPPAVSNPSSNVASAISTPPNGASANESAAPGSTPVAIGGSGNSRKGSLMVGGNGDVMPRGHLAFGTVDSPNPLLSSSPAAPSTTGAHLSDAVKSFGSIDAETNAATGVSMIRPPRRTSGGSVSGPTGPGAQKLDVHSLFAGKPQQQQPSGVATGTPMSPSASQIAPQVGSPVHDRRQSGGGFPGANGMPGGPHQYQQMPGMPNQPHLRPPQGLPTQPRSPVMGGGGVQQPFTPGQMPPQQYRASQPQMQGAQQAVRPGNGPMGMQRPMMSQQGMPYAPHGQAGYPVMYPGGGQSYYGYNPYDYMAAQQWQQQQQQQHPNAPMSPHSAQAQLPHSPAPPNATLTGSAGNSPAPTPPTRPQSLAGHQTTPSVSPLPSTPSRPMQPTAPFTPQSAGPQGPGNLSAGAATFTPRKVIRFTRPDGQELDLAKVAAASKAPASSVSSGVATPEVPAAAEEAPKKKVPSLPVIVRMETEEQKKARVLEEEKIKKIKEEEAKEEQERKTRQERRAKEEQERKAAEDKAAEEKSKQPDSSDKAEETKAETVKAAEVPAKAVDQAEEVSKPETTTPAEPKVEETSKVAEGTPASGDKDKVDELRRAMATPTTQSAAASPLASPALAAAGLPAKPVSALSTPGGLRPRPTSSSFETKSPAPSSPVASTSTVPSALSTAKAIDNLSEVSYPSSVKALDPSFNVNAQPGKFRYDRDFLMQFMDVCKEKPDDLPNLEEIGLEADTGGAFGSGRRGNRPSATSGPGRGGANRSFSQNTMGAFNFAPPLRASTSEERYRMSMQGGGAGGMMRPPSQHGVPRNPSMRGGRRSQPGQKRLPQDMRHSTINDPNVAPLVVSANAWVNARSAGTDEKSPTYIERKVKALLNKLTEEKFDSISTQILEWANKSREETDGMTLKLVIKLVFEKSTDEAHWSAMYAKLCRLLLDRLDPAVTEVIDGKAYSGGSLFRKYLLGRCQTDFESGWKAREEAAQAAIAKSAEDKERLANAEETTEETGDAPMMSDEYYAAQKAKRRGLGLIQLIGELYKLDMLSKAVIRECLVRLLSNIDNPDEEDLESTCKLLTTVGRQFEEASSPAMDVVFERLNYLLQNDVVSSRIRFMIMDIVDLRKNRWRSRKEVVPTTIAQIHQQAAREKAESDKQTRESMSRGGSRAGHSRRDGPGPQAAPGEWQAVAAGPRVPQRPTDFSNIGRGVSSALPSAPTFGPSGIFAGKKKGTPAGSTPPMSRHASTSNMFNILNEGEGTSTDGGSESGPVRRKIQLAPRTKPIPGQDGEGDEDAEAGQADEHQSDEEAEADTQEAEADTQEAEADTQAQGAMSVEEATSKIAMDLKELWGEKDAGGSRDPADIVEYYRGLPAEHRPLLSEKLSEDVFRIAKLRDAEVVAKGWAEALDAEAASVEDLKHGIETRMVSLDDDAIDFPQAYKAIAVLMRSLDLGPEEIDVLVQQIDVYGEPKVTPKMKLDKAFGQLDEEASA